jgi:hypothetical protein
MLEDQLATAEGHYQALIVRDVAGFNKDQAAKGQPQLSTVLTPPDAKEQNVRVAEMSDADDDDVNNDD